MHRVQVAGDHHADHQQRHHEDRDVAPDLFLTGAGELGLGRAVASRWIVLLGRGGVGH